MHLARTGRQHHSPSRPSPVAPHAPCMHATHQFPCYTHTLDVGGGFLAYIPHRIRYTLDVSLNDSKPHAVSRPVHHVIYITIEYYCVLLHTEVSYARSSIWVNRYFRSTFRPLPLRVGPVRWAASPTLPLLVHLCPPGLYG